MRHALLAPLATLAVIAAPAIAQAPAPAKVDIAAGTYAVDGGHSQVIFTLNHMGISLYTGQFTQPTGSLVLDPANPANDKVEVSFPIDKVSTTVPALDTHLKTADFFDVAKFPEGKFVSTKVTVKGQNATIDGMLTIHGVTKPITLQAHFVGAALNARSKKTGIGFQATATLKRSDYGMTYGLPGLGDTISLTINAAFNSVNPAS